MSALLEYVTETTYPLFEQKLRDKPLVLIYPRHRSHLALVAMLFDVYAHQVVYYALGTDDSSLSDWLRHMTADLASVTSLGGQTRAALDAKAAPEDLAGALAADLAALPHDRVLLLLDQFDHLNFDADADRFFRALAGQLPDHAQVVINARLLGVQPWNDLLHAGLAEVVGNDWAISGGIFGDEPGRGQLEVFALSGGHVYMDGRPIISWEGSLPKHLFYFFVDHPMVTRDEIFSVFWPRMSVKEATNVFHVTKRKISERLGHELTNYQSGFYIPSPKLSVHYDAGLFEQAINAAIEFEAEAPALWYKAVQLYRAPFLPTITVPWVEQRRQEMQSKYAQALIGLGRYHRGRDEMDQALGYLLRALREKPDWEDVHRDVMKIYHQQGRIDDAVAQYRQLEHTLTRMFKIAPSKETRTLFETIRAG
ncbi:MAG: bacterial transcriptional activator domain-containing protein [Anaerolineae bacterium]|nr:bacterial transcriptional activator domain-containing protein [Anaerolineae bacterium]